MGFFDPEAAIVERLQARVDAATWTDFTKPRVMTEADAARMRDRSQIAPALLIVFDGFEPTQEVGQGQVLEIAQNWIVWVAVKNASGHANSQGVRDEAGPLIQLVITALAGWKPSAEFRAMRMQPSGGPDFSQAGFGFFPVMFQTKATFRGAQ